MAFQGHNYQEREQGVRIGGEFLRAIASEGWTEERARDFVQQYDQEIKRQVLYSLMRFGFIKNENELQQLRMDLYGR